MAKIDEKKTDDVKLDQQVKGLNAQVKQLQTVAGKSEKELKKLKSDYAALEKKLVESFEINSELQNQLDVLQQFDKHAAVDDENLLEQALKFVVRIIRVFKDGSKTETVEKEVPIEKAEVIAFKPAADGSFGIVTNDGQKFRGQM